MSVSLINRTNYILRSDDSDGQLTKKPRKIKKEKGLRKNIRQIISDDKLDARTLEAREAENERIKRQKERYFFPFAQGYDMKYIRFCKRYSGNQCRILTKWKRFLFSNLVIEIYPSTLDLTLYVHH